MKTSEPRVIVVILNYNGTADTLECVESVRRLDYPDFGVLLVDNASEDPSWRGVQKKYPDIGVIENPENLGYAGGNNAGIRAALASGCDYVFILNNDTVVDPRALDRLVSAAEADPRVTVAAPKVLFYDPRSVINSCGTTMDWFRLRPRLGLCGRPAEEAPNSVREGEIFPGSALLLKKALFTEVGFFDEDFFLIHEDAELCLRNRRRGFKNILVPDAAVYHKVSKALSKHPELGAYYATRNFLYLAEKEAAPAARAAAAAGALALAAKRAALFFFAGARARRETTGFFRGIGDYCLRRKGKLKGCG